MSVEIYKVKNLDDIIQKSTFTGGVLETCIRIATQAKVLAPVAKENGGRLRNSIMYRTKLQDGMFNDSSGVAAPKKIESEPKENEGYVGSNLDYAVYQEFGTRFTRPQPYLRPAALIVKGAQANEIIRRVKEETERGVLKAGMVRDKFMRFKGE